MKKCVHCNHPVSRGDRHSAISCPPKIGHKPGSHHARQIARRKKRKNADITDQRGAAIAFVRENGKIKGVKKV